MKISFMIKYLIMQLKLEKLKLGILERIEKLVLFYKKLKEEYIQLKKFREEEDSDYIEPYLADLICDIFMDILESLFLENRFLLKFESFRAYVDNMKNSSSSKAYAKVIAMLFNLIIHISLVYYMFLYWLGEFVFVVYRFIKRYLIIIPSVLIFPCALFTVLFEPIYAVGSIVFLSMLLVIQIPFFRATTKELFVKSRNRLYFLFIIFFNTILIVFLDYFFYFFSCLGAGDLFKLFFDSVSFLEFVYDWPYLYQFWNFIFFIYMHVWSWSIFFWGYIAQLFDSILFSVIPNLILTGFFFVKYLLPFCVIFLFFYYVIFFFYLLRSQRIIKKNYFVYATLRLFIEENSKKSFLLNYNFKDFFVFSLNFCGGVTFIIFEKFFLFICTLCSLSEVLRVYHKSAVITSIDLKKKLNRYSTLELGGLLSVDELEFLQDQQQELRSDFLYSYIKWSIFNHPQTKLDVILTVFSCLQNGYSFFLGLDNKMNVYLQEGLELKSSPRFLSFRWENTLNYHFQYNFMKVSSLSFLYYFIGPVFFFSLPDNEIAEKISESWDFSAFTKYGSQLTNVRLFFANLNEFLVFIFKKDLEQILFENKNFESRFELLKIGITHQSFVTGDEAFVHLKEIIAFYQMFGRQFENVLSSYQSYVRKEGLFQTFDVKQLAKIRLFEHKIDKIKSDVTLKYLFQDVYVPRNFFNKFIGNPIADKRSSFGFLMPLRSLTISENTPIELYDDFYDYTSLTDFYRTEFKKKVSLNNFSFEILEIDDIFANLSDLAQVQYRSQQEFVFVVLQLNDSILFNLDEVSLMINRLKALQLQMNRGDSTSLKCDEFIIKLQGVQSIYHQYIITLIENVRKYLKNKDLGFELYGNIRFLHELLAFYEEVVVPTFASEQYLGRSGYSFLSEEELKKFAKKKRHHVEHDDLDGFLDSEIPGCVPVAWASYTAAPTMLFKNLQEEQMLDYSNPQQSFGFELLIGPEVEKSLKKHKLDVTSIYKYLNINGIEWDNLDSVDDPALVDIDFSFGGDSPLDDEDVGVPEDNVYNYRFRYKQVFNGKGFFYKSRNRWSLQSSLNKILFKSVGITFYTGSERRTAVGTKEQFFQNGFFHLTQSWDTSMLRRIRRDLLTIVARSPEGFLAYLEKANKLDGQKLTHDFFLTNEVFLEFLAYLEACALRLADRHYLDHLYTLGKSYDQIRLDYLEEILAEFLLIAEEKKEYISFLEERHDRINDTFFKDEAGEDGEDEDETDEEEDKLSPAEEFVAMLAGQPVYDKLFYSYSDLPFDLAPYSEDKFESMETFKIEYGLTDKKIGHELRNFRKYYKEFKKLFLERLSEIALSQDVVLDLRDIINNLSVLEQFKYVSAVLFKRKLYFSLINIYLSNYFKYYNRVFFLEKHFKDEREVELPRKYYVGPAFRSAPLILTRAYESSVGVWEDESRNSRTLADAKVDFLADRDIRNSLTDRGVVKHAEYTVFEEISLLFGRFFQFIFKYKFEFFGVVYYIGEGFVSFLFFFFFYPIKWLYAELSLAINNTEQFLDDIEEEDGMIESLADDRDDLVGNLEFDLNNTFDSELQDDDSMYNTVQASIDLGVDDELSLDARNYKSLGVNGSYYDFESRYIARPGYVSPFIAANTEQSFEYWFFFFEYRDYLINFLHRLFYFLFFNRLILTIGRCVWFIFLIFVVPYLILLLVGCLFIRLVFFLLKFFLINMLIRPIFRLTDIFFMFLAKVCKFFFVKRILEIVVFINMLPLLLGYKLMDVFSFVFVTVKHLFISFNWFTFKSAYVFLLRRTLARIFFFFLYVFRVIFLCFFKFFLLYFYFIICFQYYDVVRDFFETVFFMKLDFRDFFLIYMMGIFLVILFVVGPLTRVGLVIWELRYDYLWSLVTLWVMMYFVNNLDYLTMHYWNVLDTRLHLYGPKYFETFWEHQIGYRNVARGTKSIMALPLHSKLLLTFQPEWYNFHLKRFRKYLTHRIHYPLPSEISILQSAREFFYFRNWRGRGLIKESDYNYMDYHDIHNLTKVRYIASSLINYYDLLYGGFKADPLHYIGLTGHRSNSWFRDHSDMQRLVGDFLNQNDRTHQYAIKYRRYTPRKGVRRVGLNSTFCKKIYLKYYQDVDMKVYDLIRGDGIRNDVAYTKVIQDFWYGRRFTPHERMFYWKSSVGRVHLSPLLHGYMYVPDFVFFGAEGWGIDLDVLEYDYVNNTQSLERRRIFRGTIIKERFSVSRKYRNLLESIFFGPPT